MEELIKELENKLVELKKQFNVQQKQNYENSIHKEFEIDDIVSNGEDTAKVSWIENRAMGIKKEHGYMGISLLTGRMGFTTAKRDTWEKVESDYYNHNHQIGFYLSGVEIDELIYKLNYGNTSEITKKIVTQLELKRNRTNKQC